MAQQMHGNFALDDLTYDLIAIMHEKSQALEAYERYQQDARSDQKCADMLKRIQQQDQQNVQDLQQRLAERLQKNALPRAA
jgi:hypothetical protein